MHYTANTKPGMGDPYWYEWSVGLQYIIDMLSLDSGIAYVELQADVALGLDDVVVTYENGETLFVQVKHTRDNDTLTFGDLVTCKNKRGQSLLRELAFGWKKEKDNYKQSRVLLFTNRSAGNTIGHTKGDASFQRPELVSFLPELKKQIDTATCLEDIKFPDFEEAWAEWVGQLECIENAEDKLQFLKCLSIETDTDALPQLDTIRKRFDPQTKCSFSDK